MATHEQMRELSARLVALEQDLHSAGLHKTAHRVNAATQEIGWEIADQLERQQQGGRADG